jgi:hypothetical protein
LAKAMIAVLLIRPMNGTAMKIIFIQTIILYLYSLPLASANGLVEPHAMALAKLRLIEKNHYFNLINPLSL